MSLLDRVKHLLSKDDAPIGVLSCAADVDHWIARLPALAIGTSKPGDRGVFHGTVVGATTVYAPLSGARCVVGLLSITQSDGTELEHSLDVRTDFWIEDATGRAYLRGAHVDAWVHLETVREANIPATDPRNLAKLYANGPDAAKRWQHTLRRDAEGGHYDSMSRLPVVVHRERTVLPGDEVWVIGMRGEGSPVTADAIDDAGYREQNFGATIVPADDAVMIYLTDAAPPSFL